MSTGLDKTKKPTRCIIKAIARDNRRRPCILHEFIKDIPTEILEVTGISFTRYYLKKQNYP